MTTKAIAVTYTPHLNRTAAFLAIVIAVSIFCYGVFLLGAVAHAAKHTAAVREISNVRSELSVLQAEYLSSSKELTPETARAMGFVPAEEGATVFATAASRSLSRGGR